MAVSDSGQTEANPPRWVRPEEVAFPQVWARFDGPRPMPDGRVPSFWIQDVREEDCDEVLDMMKNIFLHEEVMAAHLKLGEDPEIVAECETLWREALQQRLAIALWTDHPHGKARIVGCNMLAASCRGDSKFETNSPIFKKTLGVMELMEELSRIHDRYGVDKFLTAYGLLIIEEFRGMGLGIEMLKARVPLCQAVGFDVTATLFTGTASQKQARRAGFHLVVEYPYKEYKYNGEVVFDITDPPTLQEMALKIPRKDEGTVRVDHKKE